MKIFQHRPVRWLAVAAATAVAASPAPSSAQTDALPGVMVQITVTPGSRTPWREDFESYILPAIQEALQRGEYLGFAFHETVVVGQPYDFVLVLHAPTFAFLDERRTPPHYAALYRRLGSEEAAQVIERMSARESQVVVTLTRSYGGGS